MKFKKIITIILILLWMVLVFYLSNQVADDSAQLSGGLTRKILQILHILDGKTIEEQAIIETIFRKLAHFFLYTLGGILILLHINLYKITDKSKVIASLIIGTAYAITDELHQLFVPGRSGEIKDVCLDSLGLITGIILLLIFLKFIERRKKIGK